MYHMISSDGVHRQSLPSAHTFDQAKGHASFIASMDENYSQGYKVVMRVPPKPKVVRPRVKRVKKK